MKRGAARVFRGVLAVWLLCGSARADDAAQTPTSRASLEDLTNIQRAFMDRLLPHLPMYFIYSPKVPEGKFEVSVKYRLLDIPGEGVRGMYLGYTQRSLWNLGQPSNPFLDTSYMPELFWESLEPRRAAHGSVSWLGYQAGALHESNGRPAGSDKRSLNEVFVRPIVKLGSYDGWNLVVMPRLLSYLPGLGGNPDITRYRGYAEWSAIIGQNTGPALLVVDRVGSRFDRNSLEMNLTFPISIRKADFASYILVQYFDGYGETLLGYNTRSSNIRAGIALVR
jgi:phospholipase A1